MEYLQFNRSGRIDLILFTRIIKLTTGCDSSIQIFRNSSISSSLFSVFRFFSSLSISRAPRQFSLNCQMPFRTLSHEGHTEVGPFFSNWKLIVIEFGLKCYYQGNRKYPCEFYDYFNIFNLCKFNFYNAKTSISSNFDRTSKIPKIFTLTTIHPFRSPQPSTNLPRSKNT